MGKKRSMIYQIYKITNLINSKIYIGQHTCNCKECSYMGSGIAIRKAIEKYGISCFKKEILFSFETFEEMNQKEAEIVNEEFVSRKDTYNLMTGGAGGIGGSMPEEIKKKISEKLIGRNTSAETREKLSKISKGRKLSIEHKEKISASKKNPSLETRLKISESLIGKKATLTTREKMSKTRKGKKFSVAHRQSISECNRERYRVLNGNRNILKIDIATNEVIESFYSASDTGFNCSNIMAAIKRNGTSNGFKWRFEDV